MNALLFGLAQLAIAIILSAVTAFLAFFLVQTLTRGLDEWEALRRGNVAIGLVLASVIVAVALVLRPALSLDTSTWDAGSQLFWKGLAVQAVELAVGLPLAVASVAIAFLVFAGLTRGLDELAELRSGNLSVACLLAGVILATGLVISQAVGPVLRALEALVLS